MPLGIDDDRGDVLLPSRFACYASGQLYKAMQTALTHPDADVRAAAERKMLQWETVRRLTRGGMLVVGSRTPVVDTPAWVTLEVAHGGFATGSCVAGGQILDWERALLDSVPSGDPGNVRGSLNRWFLSDPGLEQLQSALSSGCYRVTVPEESAIPTIAWLLNAGDGPAALDLQVTIWPFIDRLRFYPQLTAEPVGSGALISLETVGQLISRLGLVRPSSAVTQMNESLTVWNPLFDQLLGLWIETVAEGQPGMKFPDGWADRARTWIVALEHASTQSRMPSRHSNPRSNFCVLGQALRTTLDDRELDERSKSLLRTRIAASISRRGAPGTDAHAALRAAQQAQAHQPTIDSIARALIVRLADEPADGGVRDLDKTVAPVSLDSLPANLPVPPFLARKVKRALEAPLEELIERGIVRSSETLAFLLPRITSQVAAAGFSDSELARLYGQLYRAFRSRRSLLLLNYEKQVGIDELPWIGALQQHRTTAPTEMWMASESLSSTTLLALRSFPQTILPNNLVREFDALAHIANFQIPITEELASDIFMGSFTLKWAHAAALTSNAMQGSLYEQYYDLPAPASVLPDTPPERREARHSEVATADKFAELCQLRSHEAHFGEGSHTAYNGTIIEQSQILTTHNLAPLVEVLGLRPKLQPHLATMVKCIFDWMVTASARPIKNSLAELQTVKNVAYALRQAIYFLSLLPPAQMTSIIPSLRARADEESNFEWRERFEPVIIGLETVAAGKRFDQTGWVGDGRRLLGWTVGPHWLLWANR